MYCASLLHNKSVGSRRAGSLYQYAVVVKILGGRMGGIQKPLGLRRVGYVSQISIGLLLPDVQ